MNEIPADVLENMAEFDKGLGIIVGARGQASATSVPTRVVTYNLYAQGLVALSPRVASKNWT